MINVEVIRDAATRHIRSFAVTGHANFAERGQDIVCAGVSAVTVGTVNAAEKMLGIELPAKMKDGFLSATVPDSIGEERVQSLQLLLESMIVMLQTIEHSYGSHITIQQRQQQQRR